MPKLCIYQFCGFIFLLILLTYPGYCAPIAEGADKFLGNIVSGNPPSNFSEYWNQLTLENNAKWGKVERNRNQMDWSSIRAAYNYAKSKNFPYKQHTFVWGTQEPGWIGGLSASEQKREVEEWIKAYGENFPETEFIDVVNEPLNKPPSFKNALGGSGSSGWDWVVWSFETARKYCPESKLLINEFEVEYDAKLAAKYLEIIMILKEKNLIDGIGIQCHTNEIQRDKPTVESIREALDTLASSGLPLYVSELDLKGNDADQLTDYKRLFPVFWEHPSVRGITLWGYVLPTWVSGTELIQNGKERPALQWLRQYVAENRTSVLSAHFYKQQPRQPFFTIYQQNNQTLSVQLHFSGPASLRIFDLHGKILPGYSNYLLNSEKRIFTINANTIATGTYIISLTGNNISATEATSSFK